MALLKYLEIDGNIVEVFDDKAVHDDEYIHTSNDYTNIDKEKVAISASTTYVNEKVAALANAIPTLNKITVTDGIVTEALDANKLYLFEGVVSQLSVSLNESDGYAEYMFSFTSDNACVLTVPETVKWDGDSEPTIEGNKYYEVSILNNIAVISRGVEV